VILDLCDLVGIREVDDTSLTVDVLAGTFGDRFEAELRGTYNMTCGHWPQSMTLSTVGGWLACRGAGQFSTRYGKIEDMVIGLDVVLADGSTITTGGVPRQAAGPDLNQLFVGSEGTLGIITGARLRVHPAPTHERRGAWAFTTVADGLDACRRILRRGATPAVLRLYDGIESDRNYHVGTDKVVVLALDEGDQAIVDGTFTVVESEMASAERLDDSLVDHWLAKRNDVAALESLISNNVVVDTMEVSGQWADLPGAYEAVIAAMNNVPGVLAASAHCSHSYLTGGCLYFTFAGRPIGDINLASKAEFHRAIWEAGQHAALAAGMSLSHHHGVGLARSKYMLEAHGGGMEVLSSIKSALDPNGILNPGKLGFESLFGPIDLP
jgi:alkyldihydroxyacetonephosphate synthase